MRVSSPVYSTHSSSSSSVFWKEEITIEMKTRKNKRNNKIEERSREGKEERCQYMKEEE
jgi:hypothetical protein